jgi:hypothetical protein
LALWPIDDIPSPEPIPLRAAAFATPVRPPTMPNLAILIFERMDVRPTPEIWEDYRDWHRLALPCWYRSAPPEDPRLGQQ